MDSFEPVNEEGDVGGVAVQPVGQSAARLRSVGRVELPERVREGLGEPELLMLIAARVVQGASAAFSQATALALIVSTFPAGPARNRAVGVFAAMEGLGAGAGLLLGGVIVDSLTWRWVFFINVPVAALVLVLTPIFIPAPARRRDRFDLPGAVTATAGLALVVLGLSRAADHGWSDPSTLGSLLGGTAALLIFVLLEYRGTAR